MMMISFNLAKMLQVSLGLPTYSSSFLMGLVFLDQAQWQAGKTNVRMGAWVIFRHLIKRKHILFHIIGAFIGNTSYYHW